jgi:hypothetical protein
VKPGTALFVPEPAPEEGVRFGTTTAYLLMDAGKLLFGKLETKEWVEKWLKVTVRVFMKDL